MARAVPNDDSAAARTLGEVLQAGDWLRPSGQVLFLRAHPAAVQPVAGSRDWHCVQSLRPLARELELRGHPHVYAEPPEPDASQDMVLVLPPRQRDEARASLARAVASVRPGGQVLAAVSNLEGARSIEGDLRKLAGTSGSVSRNKCRVFGGTIDPDRIQRDLLDAWLALDAPTPILDGRYISRPGLFAWDRVDAASALLAEQVSNELAGQVADLGAGYGYLSTRVLETCPGVDALHLYEAEGRALAPARENIERTLRASGRDVPVRVTWHDVTAGLPDRYDAIISNPPFHAGRADRPELGQAFIEAAADALKPQGVFWMVANRHLPYEATLDRCFGAHHSVAERDGFKVIRATLPKSRAS